MLRHPPVELTKGFEGSLSLLMMSLQTSTQDFLVTQRGKVTRDRLDRSSERCEMVACEKRVKNVETTMEDRAQQLNMTQ